MTKEIERRFFTHKVEFRAGEDGKPSTVRGYAAAFNSRSENFGTAQYPYYELIAPGAFDGVLKDDVRALFNHDANLILARTKSGTLTLGVDDTGLWYEFGLPDTSYARDLAASLSRGDVDQSSFAFMVDTDEVKQQTEAGVNTYIRTIKKVSRLYDVSPVTYPAYPDTTVAVRSLDKARKEQTEKRNEFPYRRWAAGIGL